MNKKKGIKEICLCLLSILADKTKPNTKVVFITNHHNLNNKK